MKRLLSPSLVCSALMILGCGISGHAGIIITFSSSTISGDLTTLNLTGAADPVTGIGFPTPDSLDTIDTITIAGDGAANGTYSVFLQKAYNGTGTAGPVLGTTLANDQLIIAGTNAALGLSGTVLTISNLTLTVNATTSIFNGLAFGGTDNVTLSGALLSDLGLGASTFTLTSMTDSGTSIGAVGGNYNVTNESIVLTQGTPEPSSLIMATLGLALVAFGARKRFSRAE